jgi:hypothetical protein
MSEKNDEAEVAGIPTASLRIQPRKEMIASNTAIEDRVAPLVEEASIVDDMYAFAGKLRDSAES